MNTPNPSATQKLDSLAATTQLANGHDIPVLGFGTWQLKDPDVCVAAVRAALDVGYRHLDTATIYGNEEHVGQALKESGQRDAVFLTTKLWNEHHDHQRALKACDESLQRLGVDHIDLWLMHWPCGMDFMDGWHAMEKCLEQGKVRAIGTSNFMNEHFELLFKQADVKPVVNQIEFHPWLQQPELIAFHNEHHIITEPWSPLMRGNWKDIPDIHTLADAHGKHPTQIILRWILQLGMVTIPRSSNPQHIASNADLFDFELTDAQMQTMNKLDRNERLGGHPSKIGVD